MPLKHTLLEDLCTESQGGGHNAFGFNIIEKIAPLCDIATGTEIASSRKVCIVPLVVN